MLHVKEETVEEIRAIAAEKGCRLLAIESSGAGKFSVLRLVLERSDGSPVTLDECEAVSREVSPLLDVSDDIPHRYALEVSSAGLDRKLYSVEDASRFIGRRVKVRTETPLRSDGVGAAVLDGASGAEHRGHSRRRRRRHLTVVDEENRKTYNVRFAIFGWPGSTSSGRTRGGRAISR
jgi:ribosome maturation factor RimP